MLENIRGLSIDAIRNAKKFTNSKDEEFWIKMNRMVTQSL